MIHRFLLLLWLLPFLPKAQELSLDEGIKFLALGDSYTIGQNVSEEERWPNQLADSLKKRGFSIQELENIARTGWTTGNLLFTLEQRDISKDYNLVSLLIGVNNQFQGRSIEEYKTEFVQLLQQAIAYAGNDKSRVFVLSIPDYYYTPFGLNFQFSETSVEIDLFNAENRAISEQYGVNYIEVTDISRRGLFEPELVANDGLHPSGKMYRLWVERVFEKITVVPRTILNTNQSEVNLIYPNPATDFVHLQGLTLPQEISIFTLKGAEISSSISLDGWIDLRQLSAGTYILEYENGNLVQRKRVTKK